MASRADPTSVPINNLVASTYLYAREYDLAREHARPTLELDPSAPVPHLVSTLVYLRQRRFTDPLAELDLREQRGFGPLTGLRGMIYVSTGRRADALRLRAEIDDPANRQGYGTFNRALIDIALGDLDSAFAGLEVAIAAKDIPTSSREENAPGFFKTDPTFDPLRSDPRFAGLLKKLNLE